MSEEKANTFSVKDFITVVPVAGIILAAMYDFGFFASVDASLFTLFSWSDHIVFALEAVFPAIVVVSALGWSLSKFTFDAPMNQQPRNRLWFLVVLFALFSMVSLLNSGWGSAMFWGLMFLITLSAMFLKVSLPGILLAYSLGLVFGAFALGNQSGHAALHVKEDQSLLTTNSQVQGRVFRSGDRGIAFYDRATKKVSFLLWGEVKRLETAFVECQGIC
jgi:hypothetical protein